ncbi:MAG TPA: DUF1223 domain-containing protein [Polyangia bacterium]
MTRSWSMLLLITLAVSGCARPARGAPAPWNRVVLVELFTSQGCSSCPPADQFVRDLSRLGFGPDKVLPLTFHVNYWDDLGWRDPFATPAFTERQQWYARSGRLESPGGVPGLSGLYTPQMIVGGTVHFSGQQKAVAQAEFRRAAERPADVDITADATIAGDTVTVALRVSPRGGLDRARDWRVVVALAAKRTRTAVLHGENGGETLEEAAVVRALSDRLPVDRFLPGPGRVSLRKPPGLAWADTELVAWVQSETTRQIAAARAIDLRP